MDPIAIIGIGCRLPGHVKSPQDLWDMMMEERIASTSRVPHSRFNIDAHHHQNNDRPGSFSISGGYFLDDHPEDFDPTFFKISPVEAMWMDPQQRKLLEVVYEAFENSGSTLEQVSRQVTGCFVASFTSDFQQMALKEPDFRHPYATTGIDPSILANRISHVFDLKGPSVLMNTACSSSMYALNSACLAISKGECEGAVVGGSNWILSVDQHMNTAHLGVLSPTSVCHSFDEAADGYGRAEAVGALYIKRLSAALRDGNPVRAVVRSVACNSNGRHSENSIIYPSLQGQVDVITTAHRLGGLDPNCTPYIECHGTGTPTGDPVEVSAVSKALRSGFGVRDPVLVGSIKPNIGHSEAASTICTVMKAVLTLEHGVIPATAGVKSLNPSIPWDTLNVKVVTEATSFPTHLSCQRIGVSAFGYGGTNGHAILESTNSFLSDYYGYRRPTELSSVMLNGHRQGSKKQAHLLLLSAHNETTLQKSADVLSKFCSSTNLFDLAYTLANHREELQVRTFAVCSESECDSNSDFAVDNVVTSTVCKKVAFAFTGQGAQWARMGHHLLQTYPNFLETIQALDGHLHRMKNPPSWKIEEALLMDQYKSQIHDPSFSQPLCTAIQIALVDLLEQWGVGPQTTIGHSSGEIAAAYAAGLISAQDAIIAAYLRGKAVSSSTQKHGAMLAIGLGRDQVMPYILQYDAQVVVACHNSPQSTTISGDGDAIDKLKAALIKEGIFARVVQTGGQAYHSHHMQGVSLHYFRLLEEELAALSSAGSLKPHVPMFSTVTGKALQKTAIGAAYWKDNLTSPVIFNEAMQNMLASSHAPDIVIEIGPHSTFSGPVRQICREMSLSSVTYLPTLKRNEDDQVQLLKVAGELWMRNVAINKAAISGAANLHSGAPTNIKKPKLLVDLPPYPWSYSKRHWAEPRHSREHRMAPEPRHDILGRRVPGMSAIEPVWRNILRHRDLPWLKDHSLGGEAIFPAAAYFAMAIEAITQMNSSQKEPRPIENYALRNIVISSPITIPDNDDGVETLFSLRPCSQTEAPSSLWYYFSVSSLSYSEWKVHATGTIGLNIRKERTPRPLPPHPFKVSYTSWLEKLRAYGFDYGPTFRNSTLIHTDGATHHVKADVRIAQGCGLIAGESRYAIHPTSIDSCLQLSVMSIFNGKVDDVCYGTVLAQFDQVTIWPPAPQDLKNSELVVACWAERRGVRSSVCDTQLAGHDGRLLAHFEGYQCVAYEAAQLCDEQGEEQDLYAEEHWELDLEHLGGSMPELSLQQYFEVRLHKDASMRIALVGGTLLEHLPGGNFIADIALFVENDEEFERFQHTNIGGKAIEVLRFDDAHAMGETAQHDKLYDLVICAPGTAVDEMLHSLRPLLKQSGELLTLQSRDDTETSSLNKSNALRKAHSFAIEGYNLTSWEVRKDTLTNGTSATPIDAAQSTKSVLIMYDTQPSSIQATLTASLLQQGFSIRTCPLHNAAPNPQEPIIVLADIESPTFCTMTSEKLQNLQKITSASASVIWVTKGSLLKALHPEQEMARGWVRVLRNENHLLDLRLIDIDDCAASETRLQDVISSILAGWLGKPEENRVQEREYCISEGMVHIPRVAPAHRLNTAFADSLAQPKEMHLRDAPPLTAVSRSGKISLQRDQRIDLGAGLAPTDVEIAVRAIGLNEEDAAVACGTEPSPYFSHEVTGTVTAVGSMVPPSIAIGDRVFGFSFDTMATVQRTHFDLVQKMSDEEDYEEMASLPMACATALHALEHLARVEPDDDVVIVDGCAAAGLIAAQMCARIGARTIVVTESENTEELVLASHIPRTSVVRFDKEDVCDALDRLTLQTGVNLIFSAKSSPPQQIEVCSRALEPFGRIVVYGESKHSRTSSVSVTRNAPVCKYDVRDLYEHKPQYLTRYLQKTRELYREGSIKLVSPLSIKHPADLNEAFRALSTQRDDHKIVMSYNPDDNVTYHEVRKSLQFSSNATYLLVGCLGGLGRSLAMWMIERGARHLAFLSRSGTDNPIAADLVTSIEKQGVKAYVLRADAGNKAQVEEALTRLDPEYPVRGVVNAAVVFRDCFFYNMSIDSWQEVLEPKEKASRVLHELFSRRDELDFFVMTSSVTETLGGAGQSNYAASNSYLNALARHRRVLGLPGVSLILPAIGDVGYVAENPDIEASIRRRGISCVNSAEMLRGFEIAMTPMDQLPEGTDHIIVGMQPRQLTESTKGIKSELTWLDDPRLRTLAAAIENRRVTPSAPAQESTLACIQNASNEQDALRTMELNIAERLSRLLMISAEDIQASRKSIASVGLDSMIGSEFRNWIFRELGIDLPFQKLLAGNLTVTKLAEELVGRIRTGPS